ncbi:MAG: SAM-dependent methyltransferase [Pseudomonadota bacterium]
MKPTSAKISPAEPAKAGAHARGAQLRTARARFTFHGNVRETRYGWLRLTPAYSVHLVRELLDARVKPELPVLDPFCGTGTTLLTCAERGIACTTLDVNPFLVWLARAKTANYSAHSLLKAEALIAEMRAAASARGNAPWLPALFQIEKWWAPATLHALGRAFTVLRETDAPRQAQDLAKLAFCRGLITSANVSFGHQSMSFAAGAAATPGAARRVGQALADAFTPIARAARVALPNSARKVLLGDARRVADSLNKAQFGCVITSPPYANRMSYVRELRPYMYWLGYLEAASDAGELDWQAIGGTWGSATSRVAAWQESGESPLQDLSRITRKIAKHSDVLARYVSKYFFDMLLHVSSLSRSIARGGQVHYVVGNSKFFDVVLPVERLFAEIFELSGFKNATVATLRKRTSKRELFEYLVSATKR